MILTTNANTEKFGSLDPFGGLLTLVLNPQTAVEMSNPGGTNLHFVPTDTAGPSSTSSAAAAASLGDGFDVGMMIKVVGSELNDGDFTITRVTATRLEVVADLETQVLIDEKCKVITLKQTLASTYIPDPDMPLFEFEMISGGDIADYLFQRVKLGGLFDLPIPVNGLISKATSEVFLRQGATIDAASDFIVDAFALSDATVTTTGTKGVTYAQSDAYSKIIIEDGVTIGNLNEETGQFEAGDTVSLETRVNNTMIASATDPAPGVAAPYSLSPAGRIMTQVRSKGTTEYKVAIGVAHSDSQVIVRDGATIYAEDMNVTAKNVNVFNVQAGGVIVTTLVKKAKAVNVAIGWTESTANASIDGTVIIGDAGRSRLPGGRGGLDQREERRQHHAGEQHSAGEMEAVVHLPVTTALKTVEKELTAPVVEALRGVLLQNKLLAFILRIKNPAESSSATGMAYAHMRAPPTPPSAARPMSGSTEI